MSSIVGEESDEACLGTLPCLGHLGATKEPRVRLSGFRGVLRRAPSAELALEEIDRNNQVLLFLPLSSIGKHLSERARPDRLGEEPA